MTGDFLVVVVVVMVMAEVAFSGDCDGGEEQ